MVNRAMHLHYPVRSKAGLLELSIHIGGHDKIVETEPFNPGQKQCKPRMGNSFPVQIRPMAIKPPAKAGIPAKMGRVGSLDKTDPKPPVGGVRLPKTVIT